MCPSSKHHSLPMCSRVFILSLCQLITLPLSISLSFSLYMRIQTYIFFHAWQLNLFPCMINMYLCVTTNILSYRIYTYIFIYITCTYICFCAHIPAVGQADPWGLRLVSTLQTYPIHICACVYKFTQSLAYVRVDRASSKAPALILMK